MFIDLHNVFNPDLSLNKILIDFELPGDRIVSFKIFGVEYKTKMYHLLLNTKNNNNLYLAVSINDKNKIINNEYLLVKN